MNFWLDTNIGNAILFLGVIGILMLLGSFLSDRNRKISITLTFVWFCLVGYMLWKTFYVDVGNNVAADLFVPRTPSVWSDPNVSIMAKGN